MEQQTNTTIKVTSGYSFSQLKSLATEIKWLGLDTIDTREVIESLDSGEAIEMGGYSFHTDDTADSACEEYIKDSVWAFNKAFIINHCSVLDHDEASEAVLEAIQEQCESGNEAMLKLIDDIDYFIEQAVSSDGRGHFLSSYDGDEIELPCGFFAYKQ